MKTRNLFWVALLAPFALTSSAWAQLGAPLPAGPPVGAVGALGAAPVAAPNNIWSKLCMTPEQAQACREKCCASPFGQMLSGAMGPLSLISGGLIQDKCAKPTPAELAMPADSAEGAAAKIKADEAAAKKRREDVRYLGTVDCNYWPEAEDALINALRADRNECVRFEAALSLNRGCCCTQKTIEALTLTVSGSKSDGNPIENSDRVRAAAADALAHCTATYQNVAPAEEKKESLPEPRKVQMTPSEYYKKIDQLPREQVVANARQVLAQSGLTKLANKPAAEQPAPAAQPKGSEGVFGIFAKAMIAKDRSAQTTQAPTENQPLPQSQMPAQISAQPTAQTLVPARAPANQAATRPQPAFQPLAASLPDSLPNSQPQPPYRPQAPRQFVFPNQVMPAQPRIQTQLGNSENAPEPDAVEGPVDPAASTAGVPKASRPPEGLFNLISRQIRQARQPR